VTGDPARYDDLPLSPEVRDALRDIAYESQTPVQGATLGPILEGRDLMVQAQTGTGKTAAFGIPLVERFAQKAAGAGAQGVQVLILEPTRELALQVAGEIGRIGARSDVKVAAVYGGAAMGRQVTDLRDGARIVAGTPGRVLDHLRRGTLVARGLKVLVLDEADQMLSMGFAEEINAILDRLPKLRQTLLFSATIPDSIQRLAQRHMRSPTLLALSSDRVGAEAVRHFFYLVPATVTREEALLRVVEVEDPESAIVFCNTKDDTQRVAGALVRAGYAADWLNADLSQSDREAVLGATREGKLRFLVATDVAARGIDISHLTHVVNYGFPESAESYVHRTGRTGRMGRTGTAISLVGGGDVGNLYYLRLEYKIDPIERRLPTDAERAAEEETRRHAALAERFSAEPPAAARSLLRRLQTTLEGERILASLLAAEVGDDAPPARRTTVVAAPPTPPPRAPDPPSPPPAAAPAPEPEPRADREPRGRGRRRRRGRGDPSARAGESPAGLSDEPEFWERYRPAATTDEAPDAAAAGPDPAVPAPPQATDRVTLYLNVGKRDKLRRDELDRMLAEAGLHAERVLAVRLLDRHTFVDVSGAEVDEILGRLSQRSVGRRKVVAERAKPPGDR
jgi:ATP-dependent RNA helicase DeaD